MADAYRAEDAAAFAALRSPSQRPQIPDGPRSVADVLDRVLAEAPDRELVVGRSGRLSYREFDAAANRAAHFLASLGVRAGDRVAASLPTDVDIAVVFHGVLRLGALWMGINRNLAPPEKQFLLEDAGVRVLVADPEMARQVEPLRASLPALGSIVVADRDAETCPWKAGLAAASSARVAVALDPFQPAAIAYTSGTTGFPKGVVHSHHNLLLQGSVQVQSFGIGARTRRGDCFPLTILNLHVLSHLLIGQAGGSCVFMDRVDSQGIAGWIRAERVTDFTAAPAMLYSLARDPAIAPEDLASLETVYVGGADCPQAILDSFEARFGVAVSGTYGLTEAPTVVTLDAPGETHVEDASGRALPHLEVSIRDDDDRLLAPGELGEVCVGPAKEGRWKGAYTPMLGYWKQPEATERTLRGGLLHTGDLGRLSADGLLRIVDRKSLMILRGGANVYPAEVERVLHEDPGVEACAVVGVPDARLGERVAAFVEPAAGAELDAERLRQHCAERLARYKVPERIEFLEQLPRNAMNKIKRAELKEWCSEWRLGGAPG